MGSPTHHDDIELVECGYVSSKPEAQEQEAAAGQWHRRAILAVLVLFGLAAVVTVLVLVHSAEGGSEHTEASAPAPTGGSGSAAVPPLYELSTNSPLQLAGTSGVLHAVLAQVSGTPPRAPRFEWTFSGNLVGDAVSPVAVPIMETFTTIRGELTANVTVHPLHTGPITVAVTVFDGDSAVTTASTTVGYYAVRRDVLMADEVCADFVCPSQGAEVLCRAGAPVPANGTYATISSERCGVFARIALVTPASEGGGAWSVVLDPWQERVGMEVVAEMFEVASLEGEGEAPAEDDAATTRDAQALGLFSRLFRRKRAPTDIKGRVVLLEKELNFEKHPVSAGFSASLVLKYRIMVKWGRFPYTGAVLQEVSAILVGDLTAGAGVQGPVRHSASFHEVYPRRPVSVGGLRIPVPIFPNIVVGVTAQLEVSAAVEWGLEPGFKRVAGAQLHGEFGPRYTPSTGFALVSDFGHDVFTESAGSPAGVGSAEVVVKPRLALDFSFKPLWFNIDMGTLSAGTDVVAALRGDDRCVAATLDVHASASFVNDLPFVGGTAKLLDATILSETVSKCLPPTCTDKVDVGGEWRDTDGDGCSSYARMSDWCDAYGAVRKSRSGMSAARACCACGGGDWN